MPRWFDDGVRVKLSVSESGDFVSLGTRTEYPFTGSAIPIGWLYYTGNGGATNDVNWTTANGRFSVSNISTTNSNTNKTYGIWRTFPVTYGKRYVLWVQARTMENKAGGMWYITYQFNGTGPAYGFQRRSTDQWDQIACYMLPIDNTVTTIRVNLYFLYNTPVGQTERFDWGHQWQLPALVEYDSTYPEPVWHDVTCDVNSCSIAYGRSKFTGRFDVATATIGVINNDGEFTYQPAHDWGLRPGRFIKVTIATPDKAEYPAYYGLIDSISDSFPIDGRVVAQLNCIDISSLLSNMTVPTAGAEGSTAQSGIRFRALLDNIAWNPSKRIYDDGVYYQQAILANGRTVRDELGTGADSEGALFFCDRDGNVTFRDRNYLKNQTRFNTVQAELAAQCPEYVDEVVFVFPGVNGNGLTVAYEPGFAFTSWVQVNATLSFDDINSAARQTIASQDGRWDFRKVEGGAYLAFNNGVNTGVSTAPLVADNGQVIQLQALYRVSNSTVTFYYKIPSTAPSWVRLGNVVTVGGTMPTNTNPVRIGGQFATGTFISTLKGRLYNLQLWDTNLALEIDRSMFPNTAGQTTLTIPVTGQMIAVSQTGSDIVQNDTLTPPYRLIPIDNVPTSSTAAIQQLKALQTDWSRDRVINDVQIANVGGTATQSVDFESQKKYGPRTYQRLDFINDNNHPEYNTQRTSDFMSGFTEAILRVNQVTFVPTLATYKWLCSMFLMDLVRVRYQHPSEGWGFALATHVQGYVHNLTMNGWETSLNLDQPLSFAYWNGQTGDGIGWDTAMWDNAFWDSSEVAAVWDLGIHDTDIWDNLDPDSAYWSSGQVWSNPDTKWSA